MLGLLADYKNVEQLSRQLELTRCLPIGSDLSLFIEL